MITKFGQVCYLTQQGPNLAEDIFNAFRWMAVRLFGTKPLSELMVTQFTDVYMRHQASMSKVLACDGLWWDVPHMLFKINIWYLYSIMLSFFNSDDFIDVVDDVKDEHQRPEVAPVSPRRLDDKPASPSNLVPASTPPIESNSITSTSDLPGRSSVDLKQETSATPSKSPAPKSPGSLSVASDDLSNSIRETSNRSSPEVVDPSRGRKGRTIYKAQQVYVLEQVFSRTHYPDAEVIETLSKDLNITENKIKVSAA